MIDFVLTPDQRETVKSARELALKVFLPGRLLYQDLQLDGISRFQATKPVLATATALGAVRSLVPTPLGGTGGSLVDGILATEELYAIEPSISLTYLGIQLGLTPLIVGGSAGREELCAELIAPFLKTDEGHAPLASFCFSEPTGSANFFEKTGAGIQSSATYDEASDSWVINGEKIWGTSCCGWDARGADLQTLVVRNPCIESKIDSAMLIALTREVLDENRKTNGDCYGIVRHVSTPGHTATAGSHVKFSNLRIPARYVLAAGREAVRIIHTAFTLTAVTVGAMSVGIMRAAFEAALEFAKNETMGGSRRVLEHQSPADLLIDAKCQIEACRALTWKAAVAMNSVVSESHGAVPFDNAAELAYEAKIYCSEAAVRVVAEAMRVVGVRAYDADKYPFARLMNDVIALPIFDGGNQGVRRRQIQSIFLKDGYDPWAAAK